MKRRSALMPHVKSGKSRPRCGQLSQWGHAGPNHNQTPTASAAPDATRSVRCGGMVAFGHVAGGCAADVRDYAISNDEEVQRRYGELILSYYASSFTERSVIAYRSVSYRRAPTSSRSCSAASCRSTFSWYRPAMRPDRHWRHRRGLGHPRLVAGPRAGLLATVALAVCGPWFSSMFNRPDIPFAAATMGALYFLLRRPAICRGRACCIWCCSGCCSALRWGSAPWPYLYWFMCRS